VFLYAFSLAFTAGLFELAGRFAVAKLLQRNLNYKRALAAGLGHGGIEAILLVGMTYVNNLIYIVMINSGTFDALIAQAAGDQLILSQLEMIRTQLLATPGVLFALGGYERLLAMISQAAMSMVVCYGVAHRKVLPSILICLGIHTLLDCTAGISLLAGNGLSQTAAYAIIYTILTAAAVLSIGILKSIGRRWAETEVAHDSEE